MKQWIKVSLTLGSMAFLGACSGTDSPSKSTVGSLKDCVKDATVKDGKGNYTCACVGTITGGKCTELCSSGQYPNEENTACAACAESKFLTPTKQCVDACGSNEIMGTKVTGKPTQCMACASGKVPDEAKTACVDQVEQKNLELSSLKGLPATTDGWVYQVWATPKGDTNSISLGKVDSDTEGHLATAANSKPKSLNAVFSLKLTSTKDLTGATISVSLEKRGNTSGSPGKWVLLKGTLAGNTVSLTPSHLVGSTVTGVFHLTAPSATPPLTEAERKKGIWFSAGQNQAKLGLQAIEASSPWKYEGFVKAAATGASVQEHSTGKFSAPDAKDDDAAKEESPNIPGQDFRPGLHNAAGQALTRPEIDVSEAEAVLIKLVPVGSDMPDLETTILKAEKPTDGFPVSTNDATNATTMAAVPVSFAAKISK